jgi:uncharacterized membrane protein YccF (DUF307 family)
VFAIFFFFENLKKYVTCIDQIHKLIFTTMRLIGNIIWLICGGLFTCLGYLWGGFLLCLTIIGIPWGLQAMKIGIAHLAPFGLEVVPTGGSIPVISFILNLIWMIFAGIWIALAELIFGLLLCITIIGIPFGLQHFKLMRLAFSPFGYDLR